MPNIFETLKAQQDAERARTVLEEQRQSDLRREEEQKRLKPIIDAKRAIEAKKRFSSTHFWIQMCKVLGDLGAVLGKSYYVDDGLSHDFYEGLEGGDVDNVAYRWELGEKVARYDREGNSTMEFRAHYRVELICTNDNPSHLFCIRLSPGQYVRKSLFSSKYVEKQIGYISVNIQGISEDQLANALHQLYSR